MENGKDRYTVENIIQELMSLSIQMDLLKEQMKKEFIADVMRFSALEGWCDGIRHQAERILEQEKNSPEP